MDFTKPIYLSNQSGGLLDINSIAASDLTASVGPRSGYKVMATSVGASNAVGYVDKRAVDDGVDVGDAYLTGRQIDIQCAVFGSTLADFHSKMQELSDIMRINPRFYDNSFGFRELKFSQATIDTSTYTDGVAPLLRLWHASRTDTGRHSERSASAYLVCLLAAPQPLCQTLARPLPSQLWRLSTRPQRRLGSRFQALRSSLTPRQ